ncbi:hypothetical protein ECDEC14C_2384 [Escherichia coli DEC14C]|nr:hypothetical protein ECDEC14C_2384 [Escherichia coli DEC14C]EMZ73757.1 hypothetical protein EC2722950_4700 [Escherichia coli 2722950]
MPDIPVSQVILNQACIDAVICQRVTTPMSQHMWMDSNSQPGISSCFSQQVIKTLTGKRRP